MSRAMLLVVSTALALGALELMIRVLDLFAPARASFTERVLPAAGSEQAPATDKLLHPFRGWTTRKDAKVRRSHWHSGHRNLLGFVSTIDDYRDVEPGDFAIGIFGGSVASGIANLGADEIAGEVARAHPELAGRISILNLASGSYKQPQQLMVLSEMIVLGVDLDYVVNVDGLNAVALGGMDARAGHHPIFPSRPQLQALVDGARSTETEEYYLASAEIIRHRRAAARISSRAPSWLARSQLVRAFAGALVDRHEKRADELEAGLQAMLVEGKGSGVIAEIPDDCLGREEGCGDLIADLWVRSSLLMAAQASSIGAGYLHALQPNQYLPGSKPLSDEELRQAYAPGSAWMTSVQEGYPRLLARAAELRERGVDFLDLTHAFVEVEETLYVDTCCHTNPAGYGMLGERIGQEISARLSARAASR